jgi:hypothetical protein
MNALRNKVQLIGHLGMTQKSKILMEGKISQFYISH